MSTQDNLIYVVEIPIRNDPKVWVANGRTDFYDRIERSDPGRDIVLFEKITGEEVLDRLGFDTLAEAKEVPNHCAYLTKITDTIEKHGLETTFYRADCLNFNEYTTKPVNKFEAYKAAIEYDNSSAYVFEGTQAAISALAEGRISGHGSVKACAALRDKLALYAAPDEIKQLEQPAPAPSKMLGLGMVAAVMALLPHAVLAAGSAEWVKPASTLIDSLNSGLVSIGIPLVGVAIVVAGLMMAFSERPNWVRIGTIVFAGLLITVGPTIAAALLETAGK